MKLYDKPGIHLWIYNNPFWGVSDQLDFFVAAFKQHGYAVTIGKQPSHSSLNVVIENFTYEEKNILSEFCESSGKRVAVIMTEHIDFVDSDIFVHGEMFSNNNDYMHPVIQFNRVRYLMECLPYIRCFFVLGDLPELVNMHAMLPGIDVRNIPFPKIEVIENNREDRVVNDFIFTGGETEYRSSVYSVLDEEGFSINWPKKTVSRKTRNDLNTKSKIVLNLPQRGSWRWLSLMRIVAALRCGRATVSLGTQDDSNISECTFQRDLGSSGWVETLKEYVENWFQLYQTAHENYTLMADRFERSHGFPDDLVEFWAITDGIST